MTALAASNVTITVTDKKIWPKVRKHKCTIAFGNGALTYPAGGIPMPAFAGFGMARFLRTLNIQDPASADGYLYKYDEANNKLRLYQDNAVAAAAPFTEVPTSLAPAATSLKAEADGW